MSKVFKLRDRDGLELKCYGCDGWVSEVYVIANTPQEAIGEYRENAMWGMLYRDIRMELG
jgi:hypothetical protein